MKMIFRNYGGIYQFAIADADDLARVEELDLARWAATSAPLRDLQIDPALSGYLDPEATGRMRAAQLTEARDWLFARLAKREVVAAKKSTIALDDLAKEGEGARLRSAAVRVNRDQGEPDSKAITLKSVQAFKGGYAKLLANGDGVVPPGPVTDEEVKGFITEIIPVVGSKPDRGGEEGVDREHVARFTSEGPKWLEWIAAKSSASVWGDDTQAAVDLVDRFAPRLERYFLECELLRQESATAEGLRLKEDELRALHAGADSALADHLATSLVAPPRATGELDLDTTVNALHTNDFAALVEKVLRRADPAMRSLTRARWAELLATFDGFRRWKGERPAEPFEKLGEARVRELLASDLPSRALDLVAADAAAQAEIDLIDQLEKLLLLCRWIVDVSNNFVNVSGIYDRRVPNLLDVGSLVIDARRLEFCMKVVDRAAHKAVAVESRCYLIYCEIFEKEGGAESFQIVAPVTGGERGRLRVGKRGIFVDNDGKQWEAQIKEIVENPISVREAAFAPFRRAADFIGTKIEEWIGSAAESQQASLASATEAGVNNARESATRAAATGAAAADAPAAAPPAPAPKEGINVNSLIVGGGVALAGIGAVVASLFGALTSLTGWAAILGVALMVLAISALAGWVKLRKRDMALLLEASGWAMNVHMKITARVAPLFAFTPDLPASAEIDKKDVLPPVPGEGRVRRLLTVLIFTAIGAVVFYALRLRGIIRI